MIKMDIYTMSGGYGGISAGGLVLSFAKTIFSKGLKDFVRDSAVQNSLSMMFWSRTKSKTAVQVFCLI